MSRDARLESILKSVNIKVENGSQIEENHTTNKSLEPLFESRTLLPVPPPWSFVIKEEPIEPAANQIDRVETDYLSVRADDVKRRLSERDQNEAFAARMPKRFEVPIPESTASPLAISAHNSIYSFQATSANAKSVSLNSNPYANTPFDVQQNARRIGADPKIIYSRDPRLNRANIANIQQAPSSPSTAIESSSSSKPLLRKEAKDAETQTTKNTASFYAELTENRLRNLSSEEKEALRRFKEVFKIGESSKREDIKERLQHRSANRNYFEHLESRDRKVNHHMSREQNVSPESKRGRPSYHSNQINLLP